MLIMNDKTSKNKKQRLDVLLVTKCIVETRSKAQQLIKGGSVRANGKILTKSGTLVREEAFLEVNKNAFPYISRGGIKLAHALKVFNINVRGKECLDIGASTGGFTDCLLKHGAMFVYAIDVGHGQLHASLRNNPRVLYLEGIDIRNYSFPQNKKVDFICIDVSFISLTLILPIIKRFLSTDGEVIILIKPQFEAGFGMVNKRGVIKDKKVIYDSLNKVLMCVRRLGLFPVGLVNSPIEGKEGNIEYLAYLKLKAMEKVYSPEFLITDLKRKEIKNEEDCD
jgi:23S rRNA (cytidine1920-2'-O)/16S rRNA (cytidine1409-2'-O)-methyltransferase